MLVPGMSNTSLTHCNYRQTSNISHTLAGNKTVDHTDVVGALPVGAAPTTSSFSTKHLVSMDWAETTARRNENHLILEISRYYEITLNNITNSRDVSEQTALIWFLVPSVHACWHSGKKGEILDIYTGWYFSSPPDSAHTANKVTIGFAYTYRP